jgi:hypothetical protein
MRVGFLNNQIDNRGTGNAVFAYAHYNEELLGNESVIFTANQSPADPLMADKLTNRFETIHYVGELFNNGYKNFNLDVLYHIKSGEDTNHSWALPGVRYAVHAVFNPHHPHGDRFATISNWLSRQNTRTNVDVVPHIITPVRVERLDKVSLRPELGIPEDAVVYGRHGGWDSFDIPWAWDAIDSALEARDNIYFLFMNTDVPRTHRRIISVPATANDGEKWQFVNTCDAMIHARERGETFGIAPGEFALMGRPVITYGKSPERAHYHLLGSQIIPYFSWEGLTDILENFDTFGDINWTSPYYRGSESYHIQSNPRYTMEEFKRVFLD